MFTQLILADCLEKIPNLPNESVHLVVTDPPYFLDGLDEKWVKGASDTAKTTGCSGRAPCWDESLIRVKVERLHSFAYQFGEALLSAVKPGRVLS